MKALFTGYRAASPTPPGRSCRGRICREDSGTQRGGGATCAGLLWWLLAAGLFFAPASQGASLRWRWSNPHPHGGNIVDMAFSQANGLAIQVAELGQIFSSSDLDLWIPRDSGTLLDLRAIAFLGGRILVTGESGTVLYADAPDDFKPGVLTSGPTADWLEGVAAAPALPVAVAVGDNGAVYSSTNGIHWKRQTSGTAEWLRSVVFGGGLFVAAGENGKIITSANGTTWTSRSSGTTAHLTRVTYTPGRYTVLGEGGVCRSSTNGAVTWLPEVTGATNDLFHAGTAGGTRVVAGDHEVWAQDPGGPWVDQLKHTNGAPTAWTYYSMIKSPDFLLIAGRTGLMELGYASTNGLGMFWLPADNSIRNWLWDVTAANGLYVAVGDRATVLTSGNGVDWKLELVPEAATNSILFGLGGTTNLLVATGSGGSLMISPNVVSNFLVTNVVGSDIVVTEASSSTFGVVWQFIPPPTTNDLQGVGVSSNLFVVTGENGAILTSSDGTNWASRVSPTNRFLSSVTWWPQGWVATGDDGAIVTSADGITWTLVPPITTNWLYRVRYLGGKLISVGQNGTVLTSTNGYNWTKQVTGTTKWLNDLAFVGETWMAVGNSGILLTSTNAIQWTIGSTLTRKNLYAAATDSGQLVTVGVEGVILRSPVVPATNAVKILSYDRWVTNLAGGMFAQNLFLFGGKPDQEFALQYQVELGTNSWVNGPQLEFLDGSGTLFYLETVASTNLLPVEFYRAPLVLP